MDLSRREFHSAPAKTYHEFFLIADAVRMRSVRAGNTGVSQFSQVEEHTMPPIQGRPDIQLGMLSQI
jgi:hypothetical protein